ncbi:hypothetical protein EOVG_00276 [Emiliania huxleyi virus 88]|nr:hypothetical protein EOVG_00276 [Emiliania huxleyi virus 88]
MSSDGPKLSPTNVEDSTLASGVGGAGAGAAVGVVILVLVIFAVFAIIMAVSNKGLCRWTNGDGIGMYLLKSVANYFTGGILGLVMFFMYDECEGPVRRVSQRQVMM